MKEISRSRVVFGVVVSTEEGQSGVAVVNRGDVDNRLLIGRQGGQGGVEVSGGGSQVPVGDETQVGLRGPLAEVAVLGENAADQQEKQDGD